MRLRQVLTVFLTALVLASPAAAQGRGTPVFRRGYQDPAFSRGKSEGYRRGFEDGRRGDRYDPVRYREYRDGFRQGYEEGYRQGTRSSRR